jgi:Neprosin
MATIESGWQVWYNSPFPQLFVFYNPDGYGSRAGYCNGQDLHGFVRYSNIWAPDQVLDPDKISHTSKPQHGLQMQWERHDDGSWWLYIGYENVNSTDLEAVGCFPAGAYQGTGLADAASVLEFGGEVASNKGSTATGPMGSGQQPSGDLQADFKTVAFQKNVSVQSNPSGTWTSAQLSPFPSSDGDGAYSTTDPQHLDKWGSFFFFGGDNGP